MEKLKKLYPTFLEDDKKEVRKNMVNNQRTIVVIINVAITILFLFYFARRTENAFVFFAMLVTLLILLTVILIILERKILPIGKISKNKIRKICNNLHHSPKYILQVAEFHEKDAEKASNQLKALEDYLKAIKTPEKQKMLIESEKKRIVQAIEQTKNEVNSSNQLAKYYKKFASYLEEVLKK